MKLTDRDRLIKIAEKGRQLLDYISSNGITREELMNSFSLQWLVTTPLYNIGEHVYCLSDEFKNDHDDIPWGMISGLRHRLVHDYEGTNWSIISSVVFDDLPILIDQIEKLI